MLCWEDPKEEGGREREGGREGGRVSEGRKKGEGGGREGGREGKGGNGEENRPGFEYSELEAVLSYAYLVDASAGCV